MGACCKGTAGAKSSKKKGHAGETEKKKHEQDRGMSEKRGEKSGTNLLSIYEDSIKRFRPTDPFPQDLNDMMRAILHQAMEGGGAIHLSLEDKVLGDKGSLVVADLILKAPDIQSLSLAGASVSQRAAVEIGRGLRANNNLVSLDLSRNDLGERGLRGILKYINTNKTLTSLNLSDTKLDEECACLITNRVLLASNNNLETIDLSHNHFNDRCLEAFARALPANHRLVSMNIQGNGGPAPPFQPIPPLGWRPTQSVSSSEETTEDEVSPRRAVPSQDHVQLHHHHSLYLSAEESMHRIDALLERNQVVASILDDLLDAIPQAAPLAFQKRTNENDESVSFQNIAGRPYSFGLADARGRRKKMEDIMLLQQNFRRRPDEHLFGIFDGHGGVECARFAQATFSEALERELAQLEDATKLADVQEISVEQCLARAFAKVQDYCAHFQIQNGSCALVSYFRKSSLCVASVGDSKALLIQQAEGASPRASWMSETISPLHPSERERIESQGGFVTDNGRVCGVLAVSRALGDIQYTQIISAEPTMVLHQITTDDRWLILGCDGVWDVLGIDTVVELLKYVSSPVRAAQKLRDHAYEMGSRDNISVVCVKFVHGRPTTPTEEPQVELEVETAVDDQPTTAC